MAQDAVPQPVAPRPNELVGPTFRLLVPATLVLVALAAFGYLAPVPAVVAWAAALAASVGIAWLRQRELKAASTYINALIDGRPSGAPEGGVFGNGALEAALRRLQRALAERDRQRTMAERLQETLLEALPDPVLLVDGGRTVRRANAAAARLFGEGLPGRELTTVLRDPGLLAAVDDALSEGHGVRLGLDLPAPSRRAFEVRVVPVERADGRRHALISLRERTDHLLIERMRTDFVANASHEIRTPLTALRGFIETLQGPARDDPEARERFLATMAGEAERMARLVDDLLSLSSIELLEHQPPRDRVDPAAVLEHVVSALGPQAERQRVELELEIPDRLPEVIADRDQLVQLFGNLLENAIRYGGPDKMVRVEAHDVEAAAPGAGVLTGRPALRVAVTDQGPGIAREHIPRLTERFFRIDPARSRTVGGTGLGLAIVKHILRRHRGHLGIVSEPDQGSTFIVYLPLNGRAAPRSARGEARGDGA